MAEVSGTENVAKAELEAQYKPSEKARRKVMEKKADADYEVAMEICDDNSTGNTRDVCYKEAKAAMTSAKADAKANKKETEARNDAIEANSRLVFGR